MKFQEMNLPAALCERLRRQGITEATEVQERGIPAVRSGRDLIVQAQTGTGKTLAFLLPIFEKLKAAEVSQALIVAPTRELALQIAKVAEYLAEGTDLRALVLYGGQDIERQKMKLRHAPQLIVGTPGRLLDHLRRKTIDLSRVNRVVLDEADEMMKRGFLEDVELLLAAVSPDRQVLLFSATMPERVRALARRQMRNMEEIRVLGEHITLDTIEQIIVDTQEANKTDRLCEMINTRQPYLAMVFCHTRERVQRVMMELAGRGYQVDALHGELSQVQRRLVLKKFRAAELQILVTTDIAARGLDIEGVSHVFNYDIPMTTEDYIHRIGRTGRAGAQGVAITFVNARQYEQLRKIEAGIATRIQKERSERAHQTTGKSHAKGAKEAAEEKNGKAENAPEKGARRRSALARKLKGKPNAKKKFAAAMAAKRKKR